MGNSKPRVFAAGGFSPTKACVLDTMEYYVKCDNLWKCIKLPMSVPRLRPSIIVNADKVYVIGGRDEEKSHATMDIFDRTCQKWLKSLGNLNKPKENSSSIMFEGKIYCIGGNDAIEIEVLEENDKLRKWRLIGSLKSRIRNFQCISYDPL
jgi:Kelch motif.